MLHRIIKGLNEIHKQGLIHCDFHDGNILNHDEDQVFISDLGLCKPAKSSLVFMVLCHLWHLKF